MQLHGMISGNRLFNFCDPNLAVLGRIHSCPVLEEKQSVCFYNTASSLKSTSNAIAVLLLSPRSTHLAVVCLLPFLNRIFLFLCFSFSAKIKNIISTEEAKAKLLAEQQNKKKDSETSFVPTNMAVNYVQHNRCKSLVALLTQV